LEYGLQEGAREFYYRNNLDPKISPKFPHTKASTTNYHVAVEDRSLIGIGGGKDSIVVAELLKQHGFDFTGFHVATRKDSPLIDNIISLIGAGELKIDRQLDPKVFEKHDYNGHIPISAIYAFLGIFSAALYGYKQVIVGNEHSSNFGNITYKGLEINHQWSKSLEFETLFQDYVKHFITPDITYFSLLRPFYEIRIVKMFAQMGKKYFPYFSSCNRNFKINNSQKTLWCGECAKCVFVWTLLSAFLPKKELVAMFGKNLYEDEKLLPMFKNVLGFGQMKPFDCVGTFEEAQTAMHLAGKNFVKDSIMRQLGISVKYQPETLKTVKENRVADEFTFLGMEKALIVGFGKEGTISQKYLQKFYPKLKIGVADQKQGSKYLDKQKNFDIAIKTPGIKKELITIPYTTATNMFFSKLKGKNIIIGVTGSKGKSTTSSLIFSMLKTAGKNVELLGNIGKPMLETLMKPVPKNNIFVLELSSYQLDDIVFSPDISVVTNLFNEHADYHGTVQKYHEAKKNIINFQSNKDYFVYNPHSKESRAWLKNYKGKAVPFSKEKLKTNLLGAHNQKNIQAAVAAVKILGVKDADIKKALLKFKPLPHRLEFAGTFKGITFVNDANAAIPEAVIEAIEAVPKVATIFLGGTDRGYNFAQLERTVKKYKIKNIVLFPDSGNRMIKNPEGLNILKTRSMKEAVKFAYQYTPKGFTCLLSCGSPSYSLWKNFEEKGEQFKKYAKELGK
jgi:UDP-N-acetylmuramoylalanine--D-glutamate ligase